MADPITDPRQRRENAINSAGLALDHVVGQRRDQVRTPLLASYALSLGVNPTDIGSLDLSPLEGFRDVQEVLSEAERGARLDDKLDRYSRAGRLADAQKRLLGL
ncbi:MAG: hypothetical protein HYS32_04500 [Candidatus Woesearchaeota archaeon]|nr:MAG: hypothetical protein HYS32_04500 [Candidatus Woesearchaeota archaeon]